VICLFEELKLEQARGKGGEKGKGKGHTGVRQPDLFRWLVSVSFADCITRWDFMAAVENYGLITLEFKSMSPEI